MSEQEGESALGGPPRTVCLLRRGTAGKGAIGSMLDFLNDNAGVFQVVFAGVVAVATAVYAILTWRLVSETRRMRRAQTDAKMAIGLDVREQQVNLVDLFVRNEGVGPAYAVRFEVEMLGDGYATILESITALGFVSQGLEYFSPHQEIRSFLTSMIGDFESKLATRIRVTVSYSTASGERLSDDYMLDFSLFRGRHQLGEPDSYSIAKSLKSLAGDVDRLASGFHKLQVITQDKADYLHDQETMLKALQEERDARLSQPQVESVDDDEGEQGVRAES